MPKWFRTEGEVGPDGIPGPEEGHPEFAALYDARELEEPGYMARTRANAREADGTLWFGTTASSGYRATSRACRAAGRPMYEVVEGVTRPSDVAAWIEANRIGVLNVAGNRESSNAGSGERVERFMVTLFRKLAEG